MKKGPRRLSATFVRTVSTPGRYGDGHGGLSKSWAQAIRPNGRTTSVGLGGYHVDGFLEDAAGDEDFRSGHVGSWGGILGHYSGKGWGKGMRGVVVSVLGVAYN